MHRLRLILAMLVAAPVALWACGTGFAAGGNYVVQGGTPYEQQQVHDALEASSFNWSAVPTQVTIHIDPLATSEALPGEIWLDAGLLDAGKFSWGIVQHEYAHQVDFALLGDASRQKLFAALGGTDWCDVGNGARHSDHGCERFASTLAWAYWQSPDNCMKPSAIDGESGAMTPAAFRVLMNGLLGRVANGTASLDTILRAQAPKVSKTASVARVWLKQGGTWRAVKLSTLS
jgi:hypothetical protein